MEDKVISRTEEAINKIINEGLNTNNLDTLYKLSKVKHMAKEDKQMNGSYGRRYEPYGDYNNYGRRGMDRRYRGHEYMDRMNNEYGRYEEGRRSYNEGNYGAKEDTVRSLEYMMEAVVDFMKMLKEEANTQEEMEVIRRYTQKISQI